VGKVRRTNIEKANQYIADVLAGKIPACQWVRMACERQKRDLARKRFAYRFDDEKAEDICWFIENLYHVKGEWAKQRLAIDLEPWQAFVLTTTFGWVHKKTGLRRFRTVYLEVPRKNSKSTIASGVGLYMLGKDGEAGAEVYSAAVTRDQAKIVWQDAKSMVQKDSELQKHLGIDATAHTILQLGSGSKFVPLSSDSSSLEGLNIHCAIIDELHAHKTREVYDVLEVATGSRSQPLIWCVTTAGSNRSGICYEVRTYATKILQRVSSDETFFGIIYTLDDGDDWTAPETWQKANPNYGVSIYPDDFERLARKAMEMPSATNNFLTKRLNLWVNADTAWMDMRAWERCGDARLRREDFTVEPCWIGLDLASKIDIAAKVSIFRRDIDDKAHYYLFAQYYLPESAVDDGRNSQYSGWQRSGRLTITPGNVIDFQYIADDIRADMGRHQVKEVPYDPWQATQLASELFSEGVPMVEVRPTVQNFSEPMKELEKLVLEGRLHHDGCPVTTWMISNVVCHTDAKDNIFPRKERPENKIDGVVAAIMALNRAISVKPKSASIYESRGLTVL
jgi:phage terminase large subunit-like protein